MNPLDNSRSTWIYWVCMLALIFCFASAVRVGIPELVALNANTNIEGWQNLDRLPELNEVDSVSNKFHIARFFSPSDPAHHENLARISLVRASLPTLSADERRATLLEGLKDIRSTIQLRPVSPFSWTIMATIKRDLGEFDAEFSHAMHRAVDLGPWEPQLLIGLADVGLSAWESVSAEEQSFIKQIFLRGREKQKYIMRGQDQEHRDACAEKVLQCQ